MFKRIVCVLVMLTVIAAGTMLIGCGDDIKTERRVEVQDVPVGQPQIVPNGQQPQGDPVPVGGPVIVID
ncbi:MAG: hypothetical protein QGH94_13685 [Phycisphaerae bacterium]|nr:hypothetical protein [Phycisphaerae bacterium]